jgi:hypothetical protein
LVRAQWLADRQGELLPVTYFHVVFTMPAPVAAMALLNKAVVLRHPIQGRGCPTVSEGSATSASSPMLAGQLGWPPSARCSRFRRPPQMGQPSDYRRRYALLTGRSLDICPCDGVLHKVHPTASQTGMLCSPHATIHHCGAKRRIGPERRAPRVAMEAGSRFART